jgi:cell shape-determining protein MreD
MAALATLFKAFAVWILSLFFGPEIQVYILFDKQLFAELALNVLFAPIVFGILSSFNSLFVVQEE